ncbi:MAG: LacI family DNA-binding transcriptional regulator [Pleomorphochaeta sp.]
MRVTLKSIACEAGVSTTCASNILNGKTREYSDATIKKIKDIAKDRNYIPNSIARSMKTNSTMSLGLVLPDITNPYYPELAKAIEATAFEYGYNIIYINTDDNFEKEKQAFKLLYERMVSGIVYVPSFISSNSDLDILSDNIPIVMVDRDYETKGVKGIVSSNDYLGAYEATKYLIEKGKKRICFISGEKRSDQISDRILGYKKALKDNGIKFSDSLLIEGDYTSEFGYESTNTFIDNIEFDAIFAASDIIAVGALKALNEKNIKVPDDVSLLGYDNIYYSGYTNPPLTTVEQPKYEMGVKAVKMLINIINNKKNESNKIIIDPKLIIRKSVK